MSPSLRSARGLAAAALLTTLLAAGCDLARRNPTADSGRKSTPETAGPAAAGKPTDTADPFADQYADVDEDVLPADGHGSAPLRPRKADSVYKISNPRLDRGGPSPFPRLVVDYERIRDGTAGGVLSLVVRPSGKRDEAVRVGTPRDRAGTIEVGFRGGFPFAQDLKALDNCEYYLTLTDQGYGARFQPTFKVSNSAVVGEVKGGATRARGWTANEAAQLRKAAPKWPDANVHNGVGQDTPFAGDPAGAPGFRFAEADRPLLGLEWNVWNWAGQPCLAHVYPIYERGMPLKGIMPGVRQEVAKPGYAVGGLVVKATKLTHAMKVVYMKLTPDGTLDPADSYTTDWLGNATEAGAREVKLGGDGRTVIGVNLRGGAVLNAIALVMSGPAKD